MDRNARGKGGRGGGDGRRAARWLVVLAWTARSSSAAKSARPAAAPKTAVLAHGFHLQAPNWDAVAWGDGGGRLGYAYELARSENAELLVVGSGASIHEETGESEGAHALRILRERAAAAADDALLSNAEIDDASQNTRQELERFAALCRARGVDRAFCVSSPAHCPRVARDAAVASRPRGGKRRVSFEMRVAAPPPRRRRRVAAAAASPQRFSRPSARRRFRDAHPACRWFVAPCETCFADAADVAVLEPPHRPDKPGVGLNAVANAVLQRSPAEQRAFVDFATSFLERLDEGE